MMDLRAHTLAGGCGDRLLEPVLELKVLGPDELVGDIRSSRKSTPAGEPRRGRRGA